MEEQSIKSNLTPEETYKPLNNNMEPAFRKVDFKRSEEEAKIWKKIQGVLKNDSTLVLEPETLAKCLKVPRRIEEGFEFNVEERDEDFSSFHAEILLDQSSDLLDRAIKQRTEFQDLLAKLFLLNLEINEYAELDVLHQEEEANGFYDIEREQSQAEFQAEQAKNRGLEKFSRYLSEMRDNFFSSTRRSRIIQAARKAAWIAAKAPYVLFLDQGNFNVRTYEWNEEPQRPTGGWRNEPAEVWTTEAAQAQVEYSTDLQEAVHSKEEIDIAGNLAASGSRLEGLEAKSNWELVNANFRRRRTIVARKYQDIKAASSVERGGALNYAERLVPLQNLFQQDFRDALARLKIVQQGFKDIYGYDVPLPPNETDIDYFDQCLLWARKATSWLIRFSQTEQSLILPVSLRSTIGEAIWNSGVSQGTWKIDISEDLFVNLKHVRLRGLSAFVLGSEAEKKLWQLNVSVPSTAQANHISGDRVSLNQLGIPPCRLARVTSRNARREPDVFGMSALFNVSPIGEWSVQVINSVPSSTDFSNINDIHLDLHFVFRV